MRVLTTAALAALLASPVAASTLRVTVTHDNETPLFITPLYTAFHSAGFDAFDVGSAASAGLEAIAETGNAMSIAAERTAVDAGSTGGVLAAGAGPGPIFSGAINPTGSALAESASAEFDVDGSTNQYFTFLSMILPSNDTFIGSDDAIRIFDDTGKFIGNTSARTHTIQVTGNNIYDAGTEVNDATATGGGAFVLGADIAGGADENGVVTQADDNTLAAFANVGLAPPPAPLSFIGTLGGDPAAIDFFSDRSSFNVVTITIEDISQVPVPAGGALLLTALGLGGWAARQKKRHG